jgi:hypothetical protein
MMAPHAVLVLASSSVSVEIVEGSRTVFTASDKSRKLES